MSWICVSTTTESPKPPKPPDDDGGGGDNPPDTTFGTQGEVLDIGDTHGNRVVQIEWVLPDGRKQYWKWVGIPGGAVGDQAVTDALDQLANFGEPSSGQWNRGASIK